MYEYFFIARNNNMLNALKQNAHWIWGLGLALVALGTLAVIFSFASTILSVLILGSLMLVYGVLEAVQSFTLSKWSTFLLHAGISALYILSGLILISNPELNAITLTLFLALLFALSGIFKIVFALTRQLPHTGWLVLNGALNLILGILIWRQWPESGLWVLGTFMGIDMMLTGWTWVMLGWAARKAS